LPAWNQKVFRAAAKVQKATGVPIATHAWIGAKEQFEFLLKAGADPAHVNFGHVDTVNGWRGKSREQFAAELLPIVQADGYLLFNNFGCEFYTPWVDLVFLLRYFCDKGYSNRVLISEDCNWEWKNGKQVYEAEEQHPEAAKRTYAYMMTHEVPLMLEAGFTKKDQETFLVDNPRRFFSQ
jgi:predicted metal-dependent phosphotriesterase family hydrolase